MVLYWLTLGVVAAVVLVLAGYLVAVAYQLWRTRRNVAELADALETVGERTAPVPERIDAIGGALVRVEEGFGGVEDHLSAVAALLES